MTAARAGARSVVTSSGCSGTARHPDKEPSCSGDIPADRHENVDHLAVLIDRPVHVSPHASDFHIRLVDEPADTGCVSARAGGLDGQGGEVLDPAVQRDMVDLDSTLREQLLEIPVRQPETQIPPDRQQDHIRREPIASEGRSSDFDRVAVATGSHANSLTPPTPTSQCNTAD